jgi:hypothetical protein
MKKTQGVLSKKVSIMLLWLIKKILLKILWVLTVFPHIIVSKSGRILKVFSDGERYLPYYLAKYLE